MKNHYIAVLALLLLCGLLGACSKSDEQKEQGAIDKMTDKVARDAVQNIREPIERAKQIQAIENAHAKAINDAVKHSQ
jgi:hypothetical protein